LGAWHSLADVMLPASRSRLYAERGNRAQAIGRFKLAVRNGALG